MPNSPSDSVHVIDGRDKLTRSPRNTQLFNLETAPDNRIDIASKHPGTVETLSKIPDDWLEGTPFLH
jgi:hypothetical protein